MLNKFWFKLVVALGILAVVLAFLGVNFVPRILASSSETQRHPSYYYDKSDWFQRHSSEAVRPETAVSRPAYFYDNSDWFQRHPSAAANLDRLQIHPSYYYDNSDWFERHPELINR